MNGAPLQHFDYQVEYMGSSGDLHVQPVESRTQTNPWIHGWHQYWGPQTDGANLGETLTWWVKARAVNSEGVGDWSPKSEITPPLTTRPVPTLTVGLGSASTACTVPANDPTRGCYNLGVTMSGGAETEVARCVAWTNPGTWEQYGTIGLGNGYNEGCPYSLAGRHVAVVVGADIVGTPNSNTITVPPPALERGGWVVVGVATLSLLGALALDWRELLVLGVGGLLALALAIPFIIGRTRLKLTRTLVPDRVTVGEPAFAEIEAVNTSFSCRRWAPVVARWRPGGSPPRGAVYAPSAPPGSQNRIRLG